VAGQPEQDEECGQYHQVRRHNGDRVQHALDGGRFGYLSRHPHMVIEAHSCRQPRGVGWPTGVGERNGDGNGMPTHGSNAPNDDQRDAVGDSGHDQEPEDQ
jgi:hypothetical protein